MYYIIVLYYIGYAHTDTHPLRFRCFFGQNKETQLVRESADFLKHSLAAVCGLSKQGEIYGAQEGDFHEE